MNWQLILDSIGPIALGAVAGTIPLTLASFSLGLIIAIALALMRISGVAWLSGIARAYISAIRGTPLLVQLFVIFYGLPSIGITIDPWTVEVADPDGAALAQIHFHDVLLGLIQR